MASDEKFVDIGPVHPRLRPGCRTRITRMSNVHYWRQICKTVLYAGPFATRFNWARCPPDTRKAWGTPQSWLPARFRARTYMHWHRYRWTWAWDITATPILSTSACTVLVWPHEYNSLLMFQNFLCVSTIAYFCTLGPWGTCSRPRNICKSRNCWISNRISIG